MKANRLLFVAGLFAGGLVVSDLPAADSAPKTPKKPVATTYQGVTVEDLYQWLEEDNDPQVKAWSGAQNQRTRQYLDKLPDRAAVEKQLTEWYAKTSPSYFSLVSRPEIVFAMKFQPPKQQPLLVALASVDDLKSEKVVLDPGFEVEAIVLVVVVRNVDVWREKRMVAPEQDGIVELDPGEDLRRVELVALGKDVRLPAGGD